MNFILEFPKWRCVFFLYFLEKLPKISAALTPYYRACKFGFFLPFLSFFRVTMMGIMIRSRRNIIFLPVLIILQHHFYTFNSKKVKMSKRLLTTFHIWLHIKQKPQNQANFLTTNVYYISYENNWLWKIQFNPLLRKVGMIFQTI